jgi:hypothetical protein
VVQGLSGEHAAMKPGDLNRVDVSGWMKEYCKFRGLECQTEITVEN